MGKGFPLTNIIAAPPQPPQAVQQGVQAIGTLATANSMPSTPGPAQPSQPMTLDDVRRKVQDAFTAARVMKAVNNGDGNAALSAVNRR